MHDMDEDPPILRPLPRRPFEKQSNPASPSPLSTPARSSLDADSSNRTADMGDRESFEESESARTRSVLNLTASTLFGIYAPTDYDTSRDEFPTPWGTGAQTPASSQNVDDIRRQLTSALQSQAGVSPQSLRSDEQVTLKLQGDKPRLVRRGSSFHTLGSQVLSLTTRVLALFAFGVAYGLVVSKLHENDNVTPVRVEGIKSGWRYLAFWGMAGIGLGSLLPWVDWVWAKDLEAATEEEVISDQRAKTRRDPVTNRDEGARGRRSSQAVAIQQVSQDSGALDGDWNLVVRSIGVFIGIAFAIRKTPWQSTLQLSLTLALVNPVLWYILDRSKPGFVISTIVGLAGTAILLGINPDIVPSPAPYSTYSSFSSSLSQAFNRTAYNQGVGSTTNNSALEPDSLLAGLASAESVAVATWIASVLFCSSICFGNIGRKLALKGPKARNS